jgi:hypothetical protein
LRVVTFFELTKLEKQMNGTLKDQLLILSKFFITLVNPDSLKIKQPSMEKVLSSHRVSIGPTPPSNLPKVISGKFKLEDFADEQFRNECRTLLHDYARELVVIFKNTNFFRRIKKLLPTPSRSSKETFPNLPFKPHKVCLTKR